MDAKLAVSSRPRRLAVQVAVRVLPRPYVQLKRHHDRLVPMVRAQHPRASLEALVLKQGPVLVKVGFLRLLPGDGKPSKPTVA